MRAIVSDSSTKLEAQSRAAQGVAAAPFGSLRRPHLADVRHRPSPGLLALTRAGARNATAGLVQQPAGSWGRWGASSGPVRLRGNRKPGVSGWPVRKSRCVAPGTIRCFGLVGLDRSSVVRIRRNVILRETAEVLSIVLAELRVALVANPKTRLTNVDGVEQQALSRLLKTNAPLKLNGSHAGHSLEVLMKGRRAHPHQTSQISNEVPLGEVFPYPSNRFCNVARRTSAKADVE